MGFGGGFAAASARVVLGVDTRDFDRDLPRAERQFHKSTGNMGRDMSQLVRGGAIGSGMFSGFARSVAFASASFLGAAGFTAVIRQSISAASNLNEAINKSNETFGASADRMRAWAKDATEAMGQSERAALENAGSIGSMLIPMGFAEESAAGMSQRMVQLAADMASFHNQDPTEMLNRIRSGLAGQTEPLLKFGGDLRAASVDQYALETGLRKQGETLNAQGQVWARYGLLLKQTKIAQGDFERTSSGAANATRTFKGVIEETMASLGTSLLPVVEKMLPKLTRWAEQIGENKQLHQDLVKWVENAVDAITGAVEAADDVADALGGWENALKLIFALGVASKVYAMSRAFTALAGTTAAATTAGAVGGTGVAAAAGRSALLLRYLRALSLIGLITIGVEIALNWDETKSKMDRFDAWLTKHTGAGFFESGLTNPGDRASGGKPAQRGADGKVIDPRGNSVGTLGGPGGAGGRVVEAGASFLGTPYSWGGGHNATATPSRGTAHSYGGASRVGLDCSGFIRAAYLKAGIVIPQMTSQQMANYGLPVNNVSDLLPGDLLITNGGGHVIMYAGNGQVIAASSASGKVVYQPLSAHLGSIVAMRRVVPERPVKDFGIDGGPEPPENLTTKKKTSTKTKSPTIPFRLQEKLQRAEETKSLADDLKVLGEIDRHLTQKINAERNIEKRVALRAERAGIRDDITDITKGKDANADDPILQGLYLREARAADTRKLGDDLAALLAIEAYLTRRIKLEKDIGEKTSLIKERQGVKGRIADVREQMPIVLPKFTKAPPKLPGFGALVGDFEMLASGQSAVSLPGIGQILVGNMEPTRVMWEQMAAQLTKKLIAAIARRKALERSLARARQLKLKRTRDAAVAKVAANLATARAQEQDLREALGTALTSIADIDATAAAKAQQEADEADAKGKSDAEDAAREAERQASESAAAAQAAESAFQQSLIATPAEARLAMAKAEGTVDTADDLALLQTEKTRIEGNLGKGNIETEISLVNALNSVNGQIARLVEEAKKTAEATATTAGATMTLVDIERNRESFLASLRSLRSDQSNLYNPLAELRGSTLTVTNYFQQGPPDSHLWSKDMEFELKALVA